MHLRHIQPNALRMRRLLELLKTQGVRDEKVLEAISRIPRELFVTKALATDAYDDTCLPIGEQQTISMPSVVAKMTEALQLQGTEKILEIGTGCGYQTAILCRLVKRVFTIERLKGLSDSAVNRLTAMGYTNITPLVADGTLGWPQQAPFSAIIVTAAGPVVPEALKSQLAIGGRLVIPVGKQDVAQRLLRVTRVNENEFKQEDLGEVVFVPLVGQQGVTLKRA